MSEFQEFTGKTVEEALRTAREAFGVGGLQDLDFEILTQGSRGVLGMGAEPARIIAAPRSALGGSPPARSAAARPPAGSSPPAEPAPPPTGSAIEEPAAAGPSDSPAEPTPRRAAGSRDAASREPRSRRGPGGDDRRRGRGGSRSVEASQVSDATSAEVEKAVASGGETRAPRDEAQDAEASPAALEAGREILEQLVSLMGYDARVEISTGATSRVTVYGRNDEEQEALGALIGRKGERLSALQHLVNLMLSRRLGTWTRVLIDVEDYRGRRERQLSEVARRAADRVIETGQMLQLEPMSALERRWVHLALRDVEGITTQSIGEEPTRRVVVLRA